MCQASHALQLQGADFCENEMYQLLVEKTNNLLALKEVTRRRNREWFETSSEVAGGFDVGLMELDMLATNLRETAWGF